MRWRDWLGVGERRWKKAPDEEVQPAKTLWDWLQLLIVPAILIGVTFVWSATQTRSDNRREDRRIAADRAAAEEARRDATLQSYLAQMSDLMLREKLLTSTQTSAVRAVARTVTLATLRRLDGDRKRAVVSFLSEAHLLMLHRVSLRNADLRGANLRGADLSGTNLAVADLRGADLRGADLTNAYLRGAFLMGTDLGNAIIVHTNLRGAHLRGAKNLDLDRFITGLRRKRQKKVFLDSQKAFLDSLSREELAKFKLSPERLAQLRKEASGR
jgi:uncharacterized protein YjbI with pentapeptide repeats